MKAFIKKLVTLVAIVAVFAFVAVAVTGDTSSALSIQDGVNDAGQGTGGSTTDLGQTFKTIVNVLLYIVGAASVIMLIYGGIRYTISGGNEKQISGAKNTIMYAIIGLVISFLAFAIINWVLTAVSGNN